MFIQSKFIVVLLTTTALSLVYVNCLDRQSAARRINSGDADPFKSPCGNKEQVSKRVSECLKQLFDLLEGRFQKAPVVDSDFVGHCDKFTVCEKCLRAVAKDCLAGLHKTAVGAFASSTNRFKKQECKTEALRQQFKEPMSCMKAKGEDTIQVYRESTGIAQAIRDLKISPEEKMLKICCLLKEIDNKLVDKFNANCPTQTKKILEIVHSVTDDAKSTLCLNPKCQNALTSVSSAKYKPGQTFIEPVMEILLSINTE